jgi:hypothetical protein
MTTKLLRITTVTDKATSTAVAILTQHNGAWIVEQVAPSLAWMRGMDMPAIKQRLEATGAKWEWLPVSEQFAQVAEQSPQPPVSHPQAQVAPTKPQRAVMVTEGEKLVFRGIQGAIRADKSRRAIVRSVWNKRKENSQ